MVLGPSGGCGAEFMNFFAARCVLRFENAKGYFLAQRKLFLHLGSTEIPECANPYVFQGLRGPPGGEIRKSAKSAPRSNFLQKLALLRKVAKLRYFSKILTF